MRLTHFLLRNPCHTAFLSLYQEVAFLVFQTEKLISLRNSVSALSNVFDESKPATSRESSAGSMKLELETFDSKVSRNSRNSPVDEPLLFCYLFEIAPSY